MRFTYLIDGYNLIHALGLVHKRVVPRELEHARADLLHFLHDQLEPIAGPITVVFDAKRKPRHVPSEYQDGSILVRYAGSEQEADDVIEALIAEHAAPERLAVVSNDRRLRQAAARRHARSLGCEELLAHLERQPDTPPIRPSPEARRPEPSRAEVEAWLREFGDVEIPGEFRDFLDPPSEKE